MVGLGETIAAGYPQQSPPTGGFAPAPPSQTYGPPPGWDYKTATTGFAGEPLPAGATSWTPTGEPFYGDWTKDPAAAFTPGNYLFGQQKNGELLDWASRLPVLGDIMQSARRRWGDFMGQGQVQQPQNINVPGGLSPAQIANLKANPQTTQMAETPLAKVGRSVAAGIGIGTDLLGIGIKAVETGFGTLGGIQQVAQGTSPTAPTPALAKDGSFFSDLGHAYENYVKTLNPVMILYNAVKTVTSPMSLTDKSKVIEANTQAGRMAYSTWVDPALRQEYVRRYTEGQNPITLAQELQIPGAELLGQLIFDPLWLVGAGKAKTADLASNEARKLALAPDVRAALEAVRAGATDTQVYDAAEKLVGTVGAQFAKRTETLAALGESRGILVSIAGAKQSVVGQQTGDFFRLLVGMSKENPENAVEAVGNLVKAASRDAPEAAAGIAGLLHSPAGELAFTPQAVDLGLIVRRALTDENGVVDAAKFLDSLRAAKTPAEMITVASKKIVPTIEEMFPSLTDMAKAADRVKVLKAAGKDVPAATAALAAKYEELGSGTRVLEAFDRLARSKVYSPINKFFSMIYMGYNPGYAIRNLTQNYVHMFVDYGLDVFRRPSTAEEEITRILGTMPSKAKEGLTAVGALTTDLAKKGAPMMELSQAFERGGSMQVYSFALKDSLKRMLVPGRAIPELSALVDAGMDPNAAQYLSRLLINNWGDTAVAEKIFRGAASAGNADAWRTLSFVSPQDVNDLRGFVVNGKSMYEHVLDTLGTLPPDATKETAQAAIKSLMDDFARAASNVTKDGVPLVADTADDGARALIVAEAQRGAIPTEEAAQLLRARMVANGNSISAMERLVTDLEQRVAHIDPGLLDNIPRPNIDGIWQEAKAKAWENTRATVASHPKSFTPEAETFWRKWADEQKALYEAARDDAAQRVAKYLTDISQIPGLDPTGKLLDEAKQAIADAKAFDTATREGGQFVVRAGATETPQMVHVFQGRPAGFTAEGGVSQSWTAFEQTARDFAGPKGTIAQMDVPKDVWDKAISEADAIRARTGGPVAPPEMRGIEGLLPEGYKPAEAGVRVLTPPHNPEVMPSAARWLHENQPGLSEIVNRVSQGVVDNFDQKIPVMTNPKVEAALKTWLTEAQGKVGEAKNLAMQVAGAARDFTFHDYTGEKKGFDLLASYVFPYQFWYSRTYTKWIGRIVQNPAILASYGQYRTALEALHAGAPDWWKYNVNTNELLGLDSKNPLFFNLEATLNPLNGLTGVDFTDNAKRTGWFTAMLDDLGKLGASTWTPFSIATAVALYMQGNQEAAARWAGRLIPQTATFKAIAGALHHKVSDLPLQGEFDPFVQFFSGGVDVYERNRVGRALGAMVDEGLVTQAQAIDAAHSQTGPVWGAALDRAVNERAPGQIASFIGGVGFKGRTQSDITIDKFYTDYNRLWAMEPNLSPTEFRNAMDSLRNAYPFMDALLLSRKSGVDRDRALAYNVLGRIPPGASSDYAKFANIPADELSKFYDEKGHIETWNQADSQRFMAGILDLAAVLDVPTNASKAEWSDAKGRYDRVLKLAENRFGSDIWTRVDAYFAAKGPKPEDQARADAILAADPAVGQALDFKLAWVTNDPTLSQYYGGLSTIESYWKGAMYSDIERQLGAGIWDKWAVYHDPNMTATEKKAYWNANPDLKKYMDIRDHWDPIVGQKIVEFGSRLRDVPTAIRPDMTGGLGQEQLLQQIQAQQNGLPQISWPEWQTMMGAPLSRLVMDYANGGKDLTATAKTQLEAIGQKMGMDNAYAVADLAALAAGQAQQTAFAP